MVEKRLKMRICRIFRSCKSKLTDDVIDTHHHQYQLIEEFPPIYSPKPFTFNQLRYTMNNPIYNSSASFPYSYYCNLLSSEDHQQDGRKCPPVSPIISPLNFNDTLYNLQSNTKNRTLQPYTTNSTEEYPRTGRRLSKAAEDEMKSMAVVKRSSDPYSDFRASMMEMIVENQIFAANDLRNLLRCFLSLNSSQYHSLILQVFDDISQAFLCHGNGARM